MFNLIVEAAIKEICDDGRSDVSRGYNLLVCVRSGFMLIENAKSFMIGRKNHSEINPYCGVVDERKHYNVLKR